MRHLDLEAGSSGLGTTRDTRAAGVAVDLPTRTAADIRQVIDSRPRCHQHAAGCVRPLDIAELNDQDRVLTGASELSLAALRRG